MKNKYLIFAAMAALIILAVYFLTRKPKPPKQAPPAGSTPTGASGAPSGGGNSAGANTCNKVDTFGDIGNTDANKELHQGIQGAENEVVALQRILNYSFEQCLTVDGIFGAGTDAALSSALGVNRITLNDLFNSVDNKNSTGTDAGGSYNPAAAECSDFCKWNPAAIFYPECYTLECAGLT